MGFTVLTAFSINGFDGAESGFKVLRRKKARIPQIRKGEVVIICGTNVFIVLNLQLLSTGRAGTRYRHFYELCFSQVLSPAVCAWRSTASSTSATEISCSPAMGH